MSMARVGNLHRQIRRATLSLAVVSAIALLGACSQANLERYDAQATKDEGKLINSYRSLILAPILQQNCQSCHALGKEMTSIPHSDPDSKVAWDAALNNGLWNFTSTDHSKLVNKVKSGHHCWGDCTQSATAVVTALNKFKAAAGDALNGLGATDDVDDTVITAGMVVPASFDTNVGTADKPKYNPKDIVFDISAESGIPGAKFIITIYRGSKQYLVTNLRVASSAPIYLRKVEIALNGVVDASNSTFDFVEANLSSTPNYTAGKDDNVGNGGTVVQDESVMPVAYADGPGKDKIALQFAQIGKGIVDPVPTFADIKAILLNPAYGNAAGTGCASCHAANFMSPANLANEAAFRASVGPDNKPIITANNPDTSPLYTSISKGAASAMPKTGTKLTSDDAEKIRRYIKGQ